MWKKGGFYHGGNVLVEKYQHLLKTVSFLHKKHPFRGQKPKRIMFIFLKKMKWPTLKFLKEKNVDDEEFLSMTRFFSKNMIIKVWISKVLLFFERKNTKNENSAEVIFLSEINQMTWILAYLTKKWRIILKKVIF